MRTKLHIRKQTGKEKTNSISSFLSLVLLLLVIPATILLVHQQTHYAAASGTNYYVSPSGSDSNDGSQTAPFATIQKAASVVQAGQTVHVAPGTYSYFANYASGNASARIVFVSDTKWGAKLTASVNPTNNGNALIYNAGNYVDFQGFDISGVNVWMGIHNEGSYDRIIGNKVHDLAQTCNDNSSGIDDANYSLPAVNDDIIGNIVYNVGPTTFCNTIQGIYHSIPGGHILDNISFHNSGYGIHCWHGCTNVIVANNTTFNNGKGGLVFGDGDEGAGIFANSIISNNIAYNNADTGILEEEYPGSHTIGPNNQFLNNLTYGNPSGNMSLIQGNTDQNTIQQDPQFVNYQADGSGDYHLKTASPAIGAGTSIGAPTTDFDGNPIPQGNSYDIGAYEYVVAATPNAGATNTPIPTNTPTPVPPTFTPAPFVDTTPPTVTITNPANRSSVKRGSTVTIAANASDNVGITRVKFFVNRSLLCSDTTSPYSCAWTVPGKRGVTYTITAKAYDAAGNTGTRTIKVTSF